MDLKCFVPKLSLDDGHSQRKDRRTGAEDCLKLACNLVSQASVGKIDGSLHREVKAQAKKSTMNLNLFDLFGLSDSTVHFKI